MKKYIKAGYNSAEGMGIANDKDPKTGVTYYKTDPRDLITEEDMYDNIVAYLLDVTSGDYGDIDLKEASKDFQVWVQGLLDRAVEEIESGKAKSVYDR